MRVLRMVGLALAALVIGLVVYVYRDFSLSRRPPSSTSSATIVLSRHPRWKSARLDIVYTPGHSGAHGDSPARAAYVLHLADKTTDELSSFQLQDLSFGAYFGALSSTEFRTILSAHPLLSSSPDGNTLLFSVDGGKIWEYISLAPSLAPSLLYCPHIHLPGNGKRQPDWALVPSLRELLLAVLRQPDPPPDPVHAHLAFGDTPKDRYFFEQELLVAIQYAVSHLEEADFRQALVGAAVLPHTPFLLTQEETALVSAAEHVLQKEPALLSLVESTLRSSDPALVVQRERAAKIATVFATPALQETLAFALEQWMSAFDQRLQILRTISDEEQKHLHGQSPRWPFAMQSMLCEEGEQLARSVAVVTSKRGTGAPFVQQALAHIAAFGNSCTREPYGKTMNIYGVLGLHAMKTPSSRQALQKTATEPCSEPLPADAFAKWTQKNRTEFAQSPTCYAQAALAESP